LLHGLRELANVTQAEIARGLGIDPSLISRYERGQRPVPEHVANYYGERFGAADLLSGLIDIARGAEQERQRRRDPELIAKQARYPLAGDASRFIAEEPPDGITLARGAQLTKSWTLENSGTVPWVGRRLMRIGPHTGPWTLTSPHYIPIPDTDPGEQVTLSVPVKAPHIETAQVAQWKMVDEDDLLYFPTNYSMGLGMYVLVGHGDDVWS
jgi:transcriptional regulator with XRE-family HTH domain